MLSLLTLNLMAKEVVVNPDKYEWISEKDYTFQKAKAKDRANRKLASNNEITDDLMSKEYKSFRDKFLSIKSPEELDKYLIEVDSKYDSYPNDLKVIVALISPLKEMKSFAYKAYPLATKEKITHSMVVTQILNYASFMKINLPTEQWMAGFRYVTEPFSLNDENEKINSVSDLQSFVGNRLYPAMLKSAVRLSKISISDRFVFDNKLLYGTASFSDNFKRFKTFGEAERFTALSLIHQGLAQAARFQAYNVDDLIPFMKEIASLYGYDSAFLSEVDGVSAKKIHKVLTKDKYKNLFKLNPNGELNMAVAYKHMKESTRLALIAWSETRDRGASETDLFNSELITAFTNRIDSNAEVVERIVNGQTTIRSDITGETITVNFPSFYLKPLKDLKAMAPIDFDEGEKQLTKSIEGKKLKYRNYFYGRSINWNVDAYKNVFPEIHKGESVANYTKILNQAAGSDLMAMIINTGIIY